MDKVNRIKQYLANNKKQETPINIDLSALVDFNHSKTFAKKEEVTKNLSEITTEYRKEIGDLRKQVDLADTEYSERISAINGKLLKEIEGIVKKIDSDKYELNEKVSLKIERQSKELMNSIQLVDTNIQSVAKINDSIVNRLEDSVKAIGTKVNNIVFPKQVIVKAGKNVSVDTKETDSGIEYTVSARSEQNIHMLHNIGVQQIIAGPNISISPTDGKGTVTISSTASGSSSAGSTFFAGTGINITGSTITNTLPGVSLQAGNNITIVGVTISSTGGAGSTVYAGNGINILGGTITNTVLGLSALNDVAYIGLSDTDLLTYNGSQWVNTNKDTYISTQTNVNSAYTHAQVYGSNPHGAGIEQLIGVSIISAIPTDFLRYSAAGEWTNEQVNTDNIPQGVSNFYYDPKTFTGTGGVSVSVLGKTIVIYGASYQIGTNLVPEGPSNFYYRADRFVGTGGVSVSATGYTLTIYGASTKVNTNETTEGASGLYYSVARFNLDLATKTTNDLFQGTSNFYYNPLNYVGTGGVSVSVNGKTLTFYGLSTAFNQSLIGISSAQVTDFSEAVDDRVGNLVQQSDSVSWTYDDAGNALYANVSTDNSTIGINATSNYIYTIQTGLGLSNFGEKSYNSLTEKLGFIGTGGASVSQSGSTYTIYTPVPGAPTIYGGYGIDVTGSTITSILGFLGTGGVSVSVSGNTYTFYGASTKVNTNEVTEGNSGLFYSSVRFDASLATKTTNNLSEGTSNFYFNPLNFVGTGGVSVSVVGRTVTVFGLSSALNTNQITEGTSNFYWTASRLKAGTGISIFVSGVSAQIGLNITGTSAQYLGGNGVYIAPLQSKSFFLEGPTSTDFIPFFRVEQSMALVKTTYSVSGGTNWVGQVQRWNTAQGGVKTDTQASDSAVTTTTTVTSYSGASFLNDEYMAIKGASIAGGVSWLLVNVYFREN